MQKIGQRSARKLCPSAAKQGHDFLSILDVLMVVYLEIVLRLALFCRRIHCSQGLPWTGLISWFMHDIADFVGFYAEFCRS